MLWSGVPWDHSLTYLSWPVPCSDLVSEMLLLRHSATQRNTRALSAMHGGQTVVGLKLGGGLAPCQARAPALLSYPLDPT